jgi:SAM-dependent methyltransferase
MNQSWSGGYVADVSYLEGFYLQQAPTTMVLACLLGGVSADMPEPGDEVSYLELGCGVGIGALLIAASNPKWKVFAVDYNPAHIAIGTGLARAAQVNNVSFIEADLAQLAESPQAAAIPQADFVSMHGLWSWVGENVRQGIVRLLAAKTRPGGLVHISYNSLPAWQGVIGLQRLIYEAGMRATGRSDARVETGFALAHDLKKAEAKYLLETELARDFIDGAGDKAKAYLSHEYMNAHWSPAFHADVAAALAEAKLDWVASANPFENFAELMLTPEQRTVMDRFSDPIMRELVKDTCVPRGFRHDVYIRGARRLGKEQRDAAIARLTVAPIVGPGELQTTIGMPSGQAELGDSLKKLMAEAMCGPVTIGELLSRHPHNSNAPELVSVLVGMQHCQVVARPDGPQPEVAHRLNRLLGSRIRSLGEAQRSGLACSRLGTGLATPPILQFIAARLLDGEREDRAEAWLEALRADILPEKLDTVRKVIQTQIEQQIPILRQLQIVPD